MPEESRPSWVARQELIARWAEDVPILVAALREDLAEARRLTAELTRLRTLIDDAPHGAKLHDPEEDCGGTYGFECTCWKMLMDGPIAGDDHTKHVFCDRRLGCILPEEES